MNRRPAAATVPGVPAAEDAAADETEKGKPTVNDREAFPTPRKGSGFPHAGWAQQSDKVGLARTAVRRVSGHELRATAHKPRRGYQLTGGFGAGLQHSYSQKKTRNEAAISFSINKTVRRLRNESGISKITQVVNPKAWKWLLKTKELDCLPSE